MSRRVKPLVLALSTCLTAGTVMALPLSQTIIEAEKNDQVFASALANRDAAAENIPLARSRLMPQLNAQGSYAKSQQDVSQRNFVGQNANNNYHVNSRNTQLSLRQGLFRPRDWAGLTIGELQAEYGTQKLLSAQSDLWSRAVGAWVDVLGAEENLKAQQEAVESTRHAALQAQKRRSVGEGTRDVEAEAKAQHEMAKAQLLDSQETLRARKIAYRILVGQEGNFEGFRLPRVEQLRLPLLDELKAVQQTLDINPEILSAKAAETINQERLKQAKADHLPSVDLFATYSKAQSDTVNTIGTKYDTTQAGVQIVIPIFTGGGLNAAERQAAAVFSAATADRRATENGLSTQLSADWASQKALLERSQAAQALAKSAREQRRAAELGLKSGLKTWADVAEADMLIARREVDATAYVMSYVKTQARILSLLPTTLDEWPQWTRQLEEVAKR